LNYDDVVRIALDLPGVEEATSYATPSLKVRGRFMARLREPDILVLTPVDELEKQMLMGAAPETYFVTDHYAGHSAILVRLSRANREELGGVDRGRVAAAGSEARRVCLGREPGDGGPRDALP
jgi:hypothetical protein